MDTDDVQVTLGHSTHFTNSSLIPLRICAIVRLSLIGSCALTISYFSMSFNRALASFRLLPIYYPTRLPLNNMDLWSTPTSTLTIQEADFRDAGPRLGIASLKLG
jgi:hypothetical protein